MSDPELGLQDNEGDTGDREGPSLWQEVDEAFAHEFGELQEGQQLWTYTAAGEEDSSHDWNRFADPQADSRVGKGHRQEWAG